VEHSDLKNYKSVNNSSIFKVDNSNTYKVDNDCKYFRKPNSNPNLDLNSSELSHEKGSLNEDGRFVYIDIYVICICICLYIYVVYLYLFILMSSIYI
jgi:hypothetical protein